MTELYLFCCLSSSVCDAACQIHASVVRGKDGSMGFSVLVLSEDYSLVLLDKPAASSAGMFIAQLFYLPLLFPVFCVKLTTFFNTSTCLVYTGTVYYYSLMSYFTNTARRQVCCVHL